MSLLPDMTALITGAGRGIGRATALTLAREGCHVACVSRTLDEVKMTAKLAREFGVNALALSGDVSCEQSVEKFTQQTVAELGDIDILVNNAGAFLIKPIVETSLDDWDRLMNANARGAFTCIKSVLPRMMERRAGCIINIASLASLKPYNGQGVYTASKHALLGLSKVLADEMRPYDVRVTAICPGGVDTDMVRDVRPDWEPQDLMSPEDVARCVLFAVTLPPQAAVDVLPVRRWHSAPM